MANVRGLNDLRRGNNWLNHNQSLLRPDQNDEFGLFTQPSEVDPRQETFFGMLFTIFFIRIKKWSIFIFVIIILVIVFVLQVTIDGISPRNIENLHKSEFLQIDLSGPISDTLGNKERIVKYGHEVWRLITSPFIHLYLIHLLRNLFSTLVTAKVIETLYSKILIVTLIIFTSFSGNLFANCLSRPYTFRGGFSTPLLGFMGSIGGFLVFNWQNMKNSSIAKTSLLIIFVMNLLLVIIFSTVVEVGPEMNYSADIWTHVGGFISGFLISMGIAPMYDPNIRITESMAARMKKIRISGLGLYFLFTGVCIYWFYS